MLVDVVDEAVLLSQELQALRLRQVQHYGETHQRILGKIQEEEGGGYAEMVIFLLEYLFIKI